MINSTAIFAASDVPATLAYYKDVLGFESTWTWGDPPTFGGATKGGVAIMFNLQPELAAKVQGHEHWISVDEVDDLYRFHVARGARVVSEIADRPWGVREYVVEDLNGYNLRFTGPAADDRVRSKPFPEGVTIERRKPTPAEYVAIAGHAFAYREPTPGLLETTWNGVVALSPEGDAIGMVRIMRDAPGWFSIWDVAVLPKWQAKRIGSKMMKEALEMIHAVSPDANVYLFTFKHGFYERLGFTKGSVSTRRA